MLLHIMYIYLFYAIGNVIFIDNSFLLGMIGSATATPNIGGIGNDGSTAFFSSWSIGVQVGSVLGVLVGLIVIAVCIVGGIVCAVKTRNRTGEKDLLGHG